MRIGTGHSVTFLAAAGISPCIWCTIYRATRDMTQSVPRVPISQNRLACRGALGGTRVPVGAQPGSGGNSGGSRAEHSWT